MSTQHAPVSDPAHTAAARTARLALSRSWQDASSHQRWRTVAGLVAVAAVLAGVVAGSLG